MNVHLLCLDGLLRRSAGFVLLTALLTGSAPLFGGLTVSLGSASGDATESQRTFQFPAAAGVLSVSYDMYNIPDAMNIYANGAILTTTAGKVQGASTLRIPISGQTSALIVVNPGSGLAGTAWTYSVSFTISDDIPGISGWDGVVAGQTLDLNKPYGKWSDPVDLGTGAYVADWTLLQVEGARSLRLAGRYNSLSYGFGALGRGWHHTFEARIAPIEGGSVYVYPGPNEIHLYQQNTPGVYVCQDLTSRYTTLARAADGSYTLTAPDQSSMVFDSAGVLQRQVDPQGRILTLTRSAGRLTRITEPIAGVYLEFEYNNQGFVSRVSDNSGRSVRFTYDAGLEGKLIGLSRAHTGSPASPPAWQFTYNREAQLERVTDPDGRLILINYYDEKGRVASQDDGLPATEATKFIYDESSFPGRLTTTVIDRNNSTIRFTYDAEYRLASQVDQIGVTTNFTYDPQTSHLSIIEAPLSRVHRLAFDARGNLTRLTTPDGKVSSYAYDPRNNLTTITNASGATSRANYNTFNQPSAITLADGSSIALQTGSGPDIESVTLPTGRRISLIHTQGRLTRATDGSGVATQFGYDAIGRLTTLTSGLGNTLTFAYDPNDQLVRMTSPLGRTLTRTYSGRGEMLTETDPAGATMRYAYNGNSKVTEETDPLGGTTRYEYDPEDRLTAVTDPAGRRFSRTTDRLGRTLTATDGLGNVIRFTYDTPGNITKITDALNQTLAQFSYDNMERPVGITDALGRTTTFAYDAPGRPLRRTDPLGRVTENTFDERSRLIATKNGAGEVVRQLFDADNRVLAVQDARGSIVDYEFDAAGREVAVTTADNKSTRMTYNAAGQLATVVRPSGRSSTFTYDGDARLTRVADTLGNIDLAYDLAGNLTSFRTGTTTLLSQTYDALSRPLSYRDGANAVVSTEWTADGRLSRLTYPSGRAVNYTYDAGGMLSTVTDWSNRVTRYTWDKNLRLTRTERPNGTSQTRSYDAKGQLLQLRELGVGGAVITEWTYTYDAAGQLVGETASPASPTWSPTVTRMTFDADNRVATLNGIPVQFDDDGNLKRGPLPDGTVADFDFNARRRLASIGGVSYAYDVLGQRSTVTQGSASTRFVHDPTTPMPRVLAAVEGSSTTEYVYGLGLLYEETAGQAKFYHFDRRGSTAALTDATGAVKGRAYYGAWGENAGTSGEFAVRFRFVGERGVQTDPNGMLLMGERYYHPLMRRFISADPLGFKAGTNWYAYAENNPLMRTDSTGKWALVDDLIFGGGGAVLGVTGKFIANVVTGQSGTKEDYIGAAVGGAVFGEGLLYTANPFLAGAAGSAAGNSVTQGLKMHAGTQKNFDTSSLTFDTIIGTLTGFIPGRVSNTFGKALWKTGLGGHNYKTAIMKLAGIFGETAAVEGTVVGSVLSNIYSIVDNFLNNPPPKP